MTASILGTVASIAGVTAVQATGISATTIGVGALGFIMAVSINVIAIGKVWGSYGERLINMKDRIDKIEIQAQSDANRVIVNDEKVKNINDKLDFIVKELSDLAKAVREIQLDHARNEGSQERKIAS